MDRVHDTAAGQADTAAGQADTAAGQADTASFGNPLAGVRVVEVGVWHAGPGASVILADLGAEVIKVESLRGDPERHNGQFGAMKTDSLDSGDWTLIFELSNRNKKSLALDLATQEGRRIVHALVKDADVFVTNLRGSTRESLGIDYESIREANPRIIYSDTTGFGPAGDLANTGAFDTLGQAYSGMLFVTGGDEPTPLSAIVLDQLAAITTSHGILVALYARAHSGVGEQVHASLYGSAIWLMYANLVTTSALGREIDTSWNRRGHAVLRSTFKCRDGAWLAGTHHPEEPYWARFCTTIGRPDLITDERYATKAARMERLSEIYDILDHEFLQRDRDEWLKVFARAGLLFAPVNRFTDVLSDQQARANDYIVEIDHRRLGHLAVPGYPIGFSRHVTNTHAAAPGVGEHSDEVLAALGLGSEEIRGLRARNVVG